MLRESRAMRSYKYQILNFIGLDEFDLWLVKGLVIEESMFLRKGAFLSAVVSSVLFLQHFSSGRSLVICTIETPSCGC